MAEGSKKMEPWQLILILILVLAFFGGLYLMNQAITSQLESVETTVDVKTETIKSSIDNLSRKLDHIRAGRCAAQAEAKAPAADPAAENGEQPAQDGAAPAEETAPAEPEKKE